MLPSPRCPFFAASELAPAVLHPTSMLHPPHEVGRSGRAVRYMHEHGRSPGPVPVALKLAAIKRSQHLWSQQQRLLLADMPAGAARNTCTVRNIKLHNNYDAPRVHALFLPCSSWMMYLAGAAAAMLRGVPAIGSALRCAAHGASCWLRLQPARLAWRALEVPDECEHAPPRPDRRRGGVTKAADRFMARYGDCFICDRVGGCGALDCRRHRLGRHYYSADRLPGIPGYNNSVYFYNRAYRTRYLRYMYSCILS